MNRMEKDYRGRREDHIGRKEDSIRRVNHTGLERGNSTRIYRWKMQRKRQLRNRIMAAFISAFLILGTAFFCYQISNAQEQSSDISYKYYTSIQISAGDSLWSIAGKYRDAHYDNIQDYIDEVVQINHLRNRDRLISGQYLVIPYYSEEYKP